MQPPTSPTGQRAVDLIALVFERVAASLDQVERALHDQLDSEAPLIAAIGDHVFDSGGKRIRPALFLFHLASSLHDVVVDRPVVRR